MYKPFLRGDMMLRIKILSTISATVVAGILLLSVPVLAHGGDNDGHCGNFKFNKSNLSEEQIQKIDKIQDKYNDKTVQLQQKLNLLETEAYNNTLNDNIDIENVKQVRQQIRELKGEIDDLRLDALQESANILPKDQQHDFITAYLNECSNNSNGSMMNDKGMMGNGMMGNKGGMMGNGMHGMMHGNGNMMGGSGTTSNHHESDQ